MSHLLRQTANKRTNERINERTIPRCIILMNTYKNNKVERRQWEKSESIIYLFFISIHLSRPCRHRHSAQSCETISLQYKLNLFQWRCENFFFIMCVYYLMRCMGGLQWRKKRSLKDLSDWNLFVVFSRNSCGARPYSLLDKYFLNTFQNILTGNYSNSITKVLMPFFLSFSLRWVCLIIQIFMIIVSTHNFMSFSGSYTLR